MNHTPPEFVEEFFRSLGVPLKVERGNRVFPQSDRSADVIDGLYMELRRLRVPILYARAKRLLSCAGAVTGVETDQGVISCKAVILATGGASYPATGSTGDG